MPTVETLAAPVEKAGRLTVALSASDTALLSQLRRALEVRDGKLYTVSDTVRESFKSLSKELATN